MSAKGLLKDIPIFIDGVEVVERPRFKTCEEFGAYIIKIAEERGFSVVLEHPHDDGSNVIGVYIGEEGELPKCPQGCDRDVKNVESPKS